MKRWANTCNVGGVAFCAVPKVASTSIKLALLKSIGADPKEVPNHHSHPALDRTFPEAAKGPTVGFIRHPVERALSTYQEKLCRDEVTKSTRGMIRAGFALGMDLDAYTDHLAGHLEKDPHTTHQHAFLAEQMDFLGVFERIGEGWEFLRQQHPWLAPLPHTNRSGFMTAPRRIRDRLIDIYRADYEFWIQASEA